LIRKKLISKFAGSDLNKTLKDYGIAENIEDLTESQGEYILKFASLDKFRNAIFKSRYEEGLRVFDEKKKESKVSSDSDYLKNKTSKEKATEENYQKIFDDISKIAPNALTVKVVDSIDDLPDYVKTHPLFKSDIFAAVNNGETLFVLKSSIESREDVVKIWLHENGVHQGLKNLITSEPERIRFLEKVYDDFIEIEKKIISFNK